MSFHPNEVRRRSGVAMLLISGVLVFLLGGFFRSQVVQHEKYALQSETNRMRLIPLPAPRGVIYDRNGKIIADNVVGYSVSVLALREDSLRAILAHLGEVITITPRQVDQAVRRLRRAPSRPTVIITDAGFDVVSVLEEHRTAFPGLIIQSSPRRFYPDGAVVSSFVGYTGEVTEADLAREKDTLDYKEGQQIGKQGLEKQYEAVLRGTEGSQFVEVDARGRVVHQEVARADLAPVAAKPLYTNIDMDLQRVAAGLFGDTLQGGIVALDPKTGAVLALVSAPGWDGNRFIGGIPAQYWDSLRTDPRKPLYNKALQGEYPPGSTFKIATAITALEGNLVQMNEHMPITCNGGLQYGSRYFHCDGKHGSLSLAEAIAKSCNTYFYQLGLKIGLTKLLAGGVNLGFKERTGIDLPEERRPIWPATSEYLDRLYGKSGWTNSVVLNLAIGQGENAQTVLNMAQFYTALATDGTESRPEVVKQAPVRTRIFKLSDDQFSKLRAALANVVETGTAQRAKIEGVVLAGKTGTAQSRKYGANGKELNFSWFVGFAPADDPKIVVAMMLEYVPFQGATTATLVSKVIEAYLHVKPKVDIVPY
ncbi:MAG: penicillin-binding protein 2 [Gemmatimonadota bacterium]|nr:penicillin-binding protein 2 [Gemmatimonadota bacterium]